MNGHGNDIMKCEEVYLASAVPGGACDGHDDENSQILVRSDDARPSACKFGESQRTKRKMLSCIAIQKADPGSKKIC